jgi:hypothetical protein
LTSVTIREGTVSPGTLDVIVHTTTIEVIATFCAAVGAILVLWAVAPWWRSAIGRNALAMDSALALTLLPSVIHHALGVSSADTPLFAWFSVISFGLVPIVIVWRVVLILRIQIKHENDPPDDGPSTPGAHRTRAPRNRRTP